MEKIMHKQSVDYLKDNEKVELAKYLGVQLEELEGMLQQVSLEEIEMFEAAKAEVTEEAMHASTLTADELAFFNEAFVGGETRPDEQNKRAVSKARKTFLIEPDLIEAFDQFCEQHQMKKTDAITQALQEFLAKYSW